MREKKPRHSNVWGNRRNKMRPSNVLWSIWITQCVIMFLDFYQHSWIKNTRFSSSMALLFYAQNVVESIIFASWFGCADFFLFCWLLFSDVILAIPDAWDMMVWEIIELPVHRLVSKADYVFIAFNLFSNNEFSFARNWKWVTQKMYCADVIIDFIEFLFVEYATFHTTDID